MALDDKVQITISLDSSQFTPAVQGAIDKLRSLGSAGSESGKVAAQGLAGIQGVLAGLRSGFGAAEGGALGLGEAIAGLASSFAPMAAGLAALGGLGFVLKEAVSEAAEAQTAVQQLNAAINRTGADAALLGPQLKESFKALSDASVFSEPALAKAGGLFITLTGDASKAAEAMHTVADLSAAVGIDLDTATRMVAKASEGMITSLQRYGIVLTENQKSEIAAAQGSETLAQSLGLASGQAAILSTIMDAVNAKVGGAAAAQVDTYAGRVAQLKNEWGELMITIGTAVIPLLSKVVESVTIGIQRLAAFVDKMREIKNSVPLISGPQAVAPGAPVPTFLEKFGPAGNVVSAALRGMDDLLDKTSVVVEALLSMGDKGKAAFDELGAGADAAAEKQAAFAAKVLDYPAQTAQKALVAEQMLAGLAKVAESAVAAGNAIRQQFRELSNFQAEIGIKFRLPELNPVQDAVQKVQDLIDATQRNVRDKVAGVADTIAQEQAQISTLTLQVIAEQSKTGGGKPEIVAQLQAQKSLLEDQIQKQRTLTGGWQQEANQITAAGAKLKAFMEVQAIFAPSVEAAKKYQDAIAALVPDLAKVGDEQDLLSDALGKFAASGLSDAQIAELLGGRVDALGKNMEALGISAAQASPEIQALFDRVAAGRKDAEEAAIGLKALQDSFKAKVSTVFETAKPNLGNFIDFSAILSQIEKEAAPIIADLQAQLLSATTETQRRAIQDAIKGVQGDLNGAFAEAAKKSAAEFQQALQQFGSTFADLFTAGLEGGAEGFAQTASSLFSAGVKKSLTTLFEKLGQGVFGGGVTTGDINPATGQPYTAGEAAAANTKATAAIQGVVSLTTLFSQLASAGSGVNNPRQQPVGTVIGAGLTGASAGVSIAAVVGASSAAGGIIGAIVGLIIGGLMLALAPAVGKAYPYAKMGVNQGAAYFDPTQNITPGEMRAALVKVQGTFDEFWNGYVDLLSKMPHEAFKDLLKNMGSIEPVIGTDAATGGDITHGPTKGFWSDFQNWIEQGMPKEIAAEFFDPLSKGFQGLGVDATVFKQIWDGLENVDAKTKLSALNDLAVGAKEFLETIGGIVDGRKIEGYFQQPLKGNIWEGTGKGLLDQGYADNAKSFAQTVEETGKNLVDMGTELDALVGPARLAKAHELADQMVALEQQEKQFFAQLAQDIENIKNSYQASIRGLTLQGMVDSKGKPDVGAQVTYLKGYADTLWGQIAKATTPAEVMQLSQELQSTIMQINQIGGSQSVAAAEAYRKWAIEQLQKSQDFVVAALTKLGQDVADANADWVKQIHTSIDALTLFTQAIDTATSGIPPDPNANVNTNDTGNTDTHGNLHLHGRDNQHPFPMHEPVPESGSNYEGGHPGEDAKGGFDFGAWIDRHLHPPPPPPPNPPPPHTLSVDPVVGDKSANAPSVIAPRAPLKQVGDPLHDWLSGRSQLPGYSTTQPLVGDKSMNEAGVAALTAIKDQINKASTPEAVKALQHELELMTGRINAGSTVARQGTQIIADTFSRSLGTFIASGLTDRRTFVGAVTDGNANLSTLLGKIASQQEGLRLLQEEANRLLAVGTHVEVSGAVDMTVNGQDGGSVPLDGFPNRTVNARGRRA